MNYISNSFALERSKRTIAMHQHKYVTCAASTPGVTRGRETRRSYKYFPNTRQRTVRGILHGVKASLSTVIFLGSHETVECTFIMQVLLRVANLRHRQIVVKLCPSECITIVPGIDRGPLTELTRWWYCWTCTIRLKYC